MSDVAIIVAGGQGSRMGGALPKQFLPLAGKPLLQYSLEVFRKAIPEIFIVLVVPPAFSGKAREILIACGLHNQTELAVSGEQRFHSVRNGLAHIPESALRIAVHDAARPFPSISLIQQCFEALETVDAVVPLIPLHDSVRVIQEGGRSIPTDRHSLRAVQTPQCFRSEVLKKAYLLPFDPLFTDDASVVEKAGYPVHFVEGEPTNMKLTTPTDLKLAEALLTIEALNAP